MASTLRNAFAIVAIDAASSAMAETPNNDEVRACLTAAATKHLAVC
jgi:hypothetical protein